MFKLLFSSALLAVLGIACSKTCPETIVQDKAAAMQKIGGQDKEAAKKECKEFLSKHDGCELNGVKFDLKDLKKACKKIK